VTLGVVADFFGQAPKDSFLGSYAGNDRLQGTVSYAF